MLKQSLLYVGSSILASALPFFMLPVLTRYLTPSEYGQVAMFNLFVVAISSLVGLNAQGASSRKYFELNNTDCSLAIFNFNCMLILLFSTTALLFILLPFKNYIFEYMGMPAYWFYIAIFVSLFRFVMNYRLIQWQVRGQAKSYGILQVSNSLFNMIATSVFVVIFSFTETGPIYGVLLSIFFVFIISTVSLYKNNLFKANFNRDDLKYALSFGIPLIPHTLGGFLLLSVDRLMINKFLGLDSAGIYMVAVSLAAVFNVILTGVNKAYSPWLFNKLNIVDLAGKRVMVRFTYAYMLILLATAVVTYLIAPPIINTFVGAEFHRAAEIFSILVFGQSFIGMYFVFTNYIFYVKKTKYLSVITISSGIINLGLNFLLIPQYGLAGAAYSFVVSSFYQMLCTWFVCMRVYKMPWFSCCE